MIHGLEPIWLSVLQFKKTNDDAFNLSKLTIIMEDRDKDSNNDLIDEFTIALSLSGSNNVTHIGEKELATTALSYQLHCKNLPNCPTPSFSPTSK